MANKKGHKIAVTVRGVGVKAKRVGFTAKKDEINLPHIK